MRFVIYKLTPAATGKAYIGMTKNLVRRMDFHRSKRKLPLEAGYTVEILACCWDREDAGVTEAQMILAHDSLWPAGHNEQYGGVRGPRHLEKTRQKISLKATGRIRNVGRKHTPEAIAKMRATKQRMVREGWSPPRVVFTAEVREKMRRSSLGQVAWNKGKPRTEAEKAAISKGCRGKPRPRREPMPADVRAKIAASVRGFRHTDEARAKMRAAAAARRDARSKSPDVPL